MKGFTLIEVLIVVAISALLSVIAVSYSGIAEDQAALSAQSAEIGGFILRARQLSLSTYALPASANSPKICGYGTYMDSASSTYSIFAYEPDPLKYPGIPVTAGGSLLYCPSVASTTALGVATNEIAPALASAWNVQLANKVKMVSGGVGDDLAIALFIPPDPSVRLSRYPATSTLLDPAVVPVVTSKVYLVSSAGTPATITVNGTGEVSF